MYLRGGYNGIYTLPPKKKNAMHRILKGTFLWPPYGIGQAIVFSCCGFYLFPASFFPRLISAVGDWMPTIHSVAL